MAEQEKSQNDSRGDGSRGTGGRGDELSRLIHDVRNPMHVVKGLADVIAMSGALTPRQEKTLGMLKSNLDLLFSKLEELFDYSRALAGSAAAGNGNGGARARGQAEEEDRPAEEENAAEAEMRHVSGRKRVLLVEDYAPNVIVAVSFLQELGYEYDVAENGTEALEKFSARTYDAVIMDIQLQGALDGLEAARKMRESERKRNLPHTPIVATTGNAGADDAVFCKKAGIDDVLSKPFEIDDLRRKLQEASSRPL